MAKPVYKIPQDIDSSFLDMEIALQNDSGVGLKPLPVKVLLSFIASGLLCFWLVLNSFVKAGGPVAIVFFVLLWIALSFLLLKPDKSGDMALFKLPVLFNYIPKASRIVMTRSSGSATEFYSVANIKSMDLDNGIVTFADDTYGLIYSVVGSGSVLLFESDRDAILNRVDAFYRKMKTDYELIFITAKEAQNVKHAVARMDERIQNLYGDDPDLMALAKTERDVLTDHVAGEFRSIHQYMILKADNKESLIVGLNMIESECQSSTLVFKRCAVLTNEDLLHMFSKIYKGKESI